jgi:hypothetical protein
VAKQDNSAKAEAIVERLKELVKKGSVNRIRMLKDGKVILNIPVNAGVVGALVGMVYVPWALILAAITTYGLDCRFELEKSNGEIIALDSTFFTKKAVDLGSNLAEQIIDRQTKREEEEKDAADVYIDADDDDLIWDGEKWKK